MALHVCSWCHGLNGSPYRVGDVVGGYVADVAIGADEEHRAKAPKCRAAGCKGYIQPPAASTVVPVT